MDIDTRLLRYFLAVADTENPARAAQRLHVAQPTLATQIKQLEQQLGVELFIRSRAGWTLTAAGKVLAAQVPGLLAGWDRILRDTKSDASRAARVLRLGLVHSAAEGYIPEIIRVFHRLHPDWQVDIHSGGWTDPTAGLDEGDVDVALLRLPFPGQDGYHVRELFSEPRWIALPENHPLAQREDIAFRELWDEPYVASPAETGWWRDYWMGLDSRPADTAIIGAIARSTDEWLNAIANDFGVSLTPVSTARTNAHPGVVFRPVHGIGPTRVALVWPDASEADPVVRYFIRCCTDIMGNQDGRRTS
ncbi:LysR family transcriptional regulator [Nocardia crassostreae]|uniref:LysR family transcriptional regulator n=1 Tax=Nocardia crassostreae TaxID=53428 RepID=UPI00083234D2|nr:LysR family transcriptional regulator [Nocardia crassostreae]